MEHIQPAWASRSRQQHLTAQGSTNARTTAQGSSSHRTLESRNQHSHNSRIMVGQSRSSSHNAPGPALKSTRPLAQEEQLYFEMLCRTSRNQDLLTLRAIDRNETRLQCRTRLQDELDTFHAHVTRVPGPSITDTSLTMLATTSENLVDLCRKAGAPPPPSKITFTELMRMYKENSEKKSRKSSATHTEPRGVSRTSLGAASRHSADDMDLDVETQKTGEAVGTPRSSRTKGKQRARRKMWEEEEGDILDALD